MSPEFYISVEYYNVSYAIWCGEQRIIAGSRDHSKSRASLVLTPVHSGFSRPCKKIPGIFCSGHRHSLHVSQSAADWDIRFRGFSNDVCRERFRDYSFRETVTRKCKDTENTWARQF